MARRPATAVAAARRRPRPTASAPPARAGRLTNFFDGQFKGPAASIGGFTGGKRDRLTDDWEPGTVGPNRAFQLDGRRLRERAWDLFRNNPFAQSAINAYLANVIECGILPERNEDWEWEFDRWSGMSLHGTRDCDVTREQTIHELAVTWLTELLVGGGCLTHFVTMSRRSRRVPLAIELIGEDQFAEHLDHYGRNSKTANQVVNGHELDPATKETIAYHVLKGNPGDLDLDPFETVRLPRSVCEYAFLKEQTRQKRGTTALKAVVMWLWALGYYTDNELAASNAKSSWAYMIKTLLGTDLPELLDPASGQAGLYDLSGNRIKQHQRAMVWQGHASDTIETLGPTVPQAESLPWIQMIQRSIAIGCRLSYEEVFRDYSKGSFSSVRMARGQDIKRYSPLQWFAIAHFYGPAVRWFDLAAVGAGIPGFPSPEKFADTIDDLYRQHDWQTPGWESPNPRDDALADDIRLQNRTITRKEILGRRGGSWNRCRKQFAREMREMEQDEILPPVEQQARAAAEAALREPNNERDGGGSEDA